MKYKTVEKYYKHYDRRSYENLDKPKHVLYLQTNASFLKKIRKVTQIRLLFSKIY